MSDIDVALAKRALALLDLTDLSDTASETTTEALCAAATHKVGRVAAVCLWPQFVSLAAERLAGSRVRVATVVNFPKGGTDEGRVLDDTHEALNDGADEIDLVLPYRAYLDGDAATARSMVEAVADALGAGNRLKVILETGAFPDARKIAGASRLAIKAGADFIKTSTGKIAIAATPQAARAMLGEIKKSGEAVGLKPSGGIRTLADAKTYLDLADEIMGADWAKPATFRFGASGLHGVLVAAIEGGLKPKAARKGY